MMELTLLMLLFMTGQQKSILCGPPDWSTLHGCLFLICIKSKVAHISHYPTIPHTLINSGISDSVFLFSVQEPKEPMRNPLSKTAFTKCSVLFSDKTLGGVFLC